MSGLCGLEQISPANFTKALSLVSINGLTGPIQFNQTQPDRRRANFDIYQYRSNGTPEQVGYWNITGPFLGKNLLEFKTSPAYPVSIIIPETTDFGSGFWPVLVAVCSGIGIFVALCLLAFFTAFYRSRVIRRTNLLWVWIMFSGIISVLSSLILWTFVQTTFICTIKSILGMVGFSFITA